MSKPVSGRSLASWAATVVLLALTLALRGPAQQPVQLPPAQTTVVSIQAATRGENPEEEPPQSDEDEEEEGPTKVFTPVPQGRGGLPLPGSPPTEPRLTSSPGGRDAPCDFRVFMNNPVNLAGASVSGSTAEPNVAVNGDGVLYTANWFAARSSDSGMTWARYSPYAFFPASDGGFCCDQRALFVRNPDMVIWLLEYSYSPTTQQGRLRIGFTRSQTDLKNDTFYYFDIAPSTFGLGAGRFLDYSDIAYSNGYLYGSAIIATPPNTAGGLVMWRASLLDIWNLGSLGISYYTSSTLGGVGSYRFAQGAGSTMYWAAHTSTTNLRVYSWVDGAGAASQVDRTVATWSNSPTAAAGPDGRDWTGFAYTFNTVLTGYAKSGECGFLWTSGAVTGRPQAFVRVARFRTSDLALIGQEDIWSSNVAWHFPTCATNAVGEVGGTLAYGGGGATGFYPSTAVFLVDSCSPNWAPIANSTIAFGARGPSTNRWGDFLGAGRHSVVTNTFVAAGFALDSTGNTIPRFAWFGRERDEPGWVTANVAARDLGGTVQLNVPITVVQTDRSGLKDGTSPFTRSYPPRQAWDLTAPDAATGPGGTLFRFEHWIYQGTPQPAGQRVLSVGDLGTGPRTVLAEARYEPLRRLTVSSIPTSGVGITVTPVDRNGLGSGSTTFTRNHLDATTVTLTAPDTISGRYLRRWTVNGAAMPARQRTVQVLMDRDVAAVADYGGVAGTGTEWTDLTAASPTAPNGRLMHALAYDAGRDRVVLFGGSPDGTANLGDTWELAGSVWTNTGVAQHPSDRMGHVMAYAANRAQTVLFGGRQGGGLFFNFLNDTWTWNGTTWATLATVNPPPARALAAATYVPSAGGIVMFGGSNLLTAFTDTWFLNTATATWTQLGPATSPPSMSGASMSYDAARNRVVLVGRTAASTAQEVWEYDFTNWTQAANAGPVSRGGLATLYDDLRQRTVLFGGGWSVIGVQNDTWEFDGTAWTERVPLNVPGAREWHAMAWDSLRHRCVLFGGSSGNLGLGPRNDTWQYEYGCEIVGAGHRGGGIPITCTTPPRLGTNFCVQFASASGVAALLIGFHPPPHPGTPVFPPFFCAPGTLFTPGDVTLNVGGNPALQCIAVPSDPVLAYRALTLQGVTIEAATCLRLTDGMLVVLHP